MPFKERVFNNVPILLYLGLVLTSAAVGAGPRACPKRDCPYEKWPTIESSPYIRERGRPAR